MTFEFPTIKNDSEQEKKFNELSNMVFNHYFRFKESSEAENYRESIEYFKNKMEKKGIDISKYRFSKMLLHPKGDIDYINDDTDDHVIENFIINICTKQNEQEAA